MEYVKLKKIGIVKSIPKHEYEANKEKYKDHELVKEKEVKTTDNSLEAKKGKGE